MVVENRLVSDLEKKVDKIEKKIDRIEKKLDEHIELIMNAYRPLRKPLDKLREWF